MNYELAPQYMSLELAIELQKAGFTRTFNGNAGIEVMVSSDAYAGLVYLPTLEELIEACGDDILGLNRTHDDSGEPNGWVADTHTHACDCGKDNCFDFNWEHESGATPTEAVARLWLVINKKT